MDFRLIKSSQEGLSPKDIKRWAIDTIMQNQTSAVAHLNAAPPSSSEVKNIADAPSTSPSETNTISDEVSLARQIVDASYRGEELTK